MKNLKKYTSMLVTANVLVGGVASSSTNALFNLFESIDTKIGRVSKKLDEATAKLGTYDEKTIQELKGMKEAKKSSDEVLNWMHKKALEHKNKPWSKTEGLCALPMLCRADKDQDNVLAEIGTKTGAYAAQAEAYNTLAQLKSTDPRATALTQRNNQLTSKLTKVTSMATDAMHNDQKEYTQDNFGMTPEDLLTMLSSTCPDIEQ